MIFQRFSAITLRKMTDCFSRKQKHQSWGLRSKYISLCECVSCVCIILRLTTTYASFVFLFVLLFLTNNYFALFEKIKSNRKERVSFFFLSTNGMSGMMRITREPICILMINRPYALKMFECCQVDVRQSKRSY